MFGFLQKHEKKVEDKIDGTFDFDDGLDLEEFNFDLEPQKDDRKPVTKIKDGLVSGIKSGLTDSVFLTNTAKDIFPAGIGNTIDAAKTLTESTSRLYDDTLKEIKPAVKDFKRLTTKLIPETHDYVPQKVLDIVNGWREDQKNEGQPLSATNQREQMLEMQLAQIFEQQQNLQQKQDTRDNLNAAIEMSRHRDDLNVSTQIAQSVQSQENYNRNVDLIFKKKIMELSYRQLFALQDLVELNRSQTQLQGQALPDIVKNTGLPEFLKQQSGEAIKEMNKRKMAEAISDGMFGGTRETVNRVITGVRENLTKKIKEQARGFREGILEANTGADMLSVSPDSIDKTELGSNVVGSFGAQWGGKKLGQLLKKTVLDKSSMLQNASLAADNFLQTIPGRLKDFKNSNTPYRDGILGGAISMAQDAAKSLLPGSTKNLALDQNLNSNLNEAYHFTKRDIRSITDVIPGYLARILREVQIFRTGEKNIGLTLYDYETGKFKDRTVMLKKVLDKVIDQPALDSVHSNLNRAIGQTGVKNLDDDAIESLKRALLHTAANGDRGDVKDLLDPKKYVGPGAERAHSAMVDFYKNSDEQTRHVMQMRILGVMDGVKGSKAQIENHRKLGYTDLLQELGIVNDDNTAVDDSKYLEYIIKLAGDRQKYNPDYYSQRRVFSAPQEGYLEEKLGSIHPELHAASKKFNAKMQAIYGGSISEKKYQNEWSGVPTVSAITMQDATDRFKSVWNDTKQVAENKVKATRDSVEKNVENIRQKLDREKLRASLEDRLDQAQTKLNDIKEKVGGFGDRVQNTYSNVQQHYHQHGPQDTLSHYSTEIKNDLSKRVSNAQQAFHQKYSTTVGPSVSKYAPVFNYEYQPTHTQTEPDYTVESASAIKHQFDQNTPSIVMPQDIPHIQTPDIAQSNKPAINPIKPELASGSFINPELNGVTGQAVAEQKQNQSSQERSQPWFDDRQYWIKMEEVVGTRLDKLASIPSSIKQSLNEADSQSKAGLFEQAIEIIEKIESKVSTEQGLKKVLEILERMSQSLAASLEIRTDNSGETKKSWKDKISSFWKRKDKQTPLEPDRRKSRFSIPGLIGGTAEKTASLVGKTGSVLGGMFMGSAKLNMKMLGAVGSAVRSVVTKVRDVYVEGETLPRMTAKDILKGKYFKVSDGKVLRHHNDIDGPIADADGQQVITKDELKQIYVVTGLRRLKTFLFKSGKLATNLLKGVWNVQKWSFGIATQMAPAVLKAPWTIAKSAWNIIGGVLDEPVDIYVPGLKDPILLASVMRRGGYLSKTSGRPITRPSQIDGPIMNLQGEEVLSLEMFNKGIFDKYGKRIKTPVAKIASFAKGVVQGAWNIHKKAWSLAWDANKAMLKGAGKVASKVLGTVTGGFSLEVGSRKTVTVLEQIRDFLKATFAPHKKILGDADGDGIRENSWQDKARKKAAAAKDSAKSKIQEMKDRFSKKEAPKKDDSSGGLFSIFGKLGSMVDSVKGLLGMSKGAGIVLSKLGGIISKLLGVGALGSSLLGAATSVGGAIAGAGSALVSGTVAVGGAVATGATTLGSMALSTVGAIGGGLLSVLSSPVVLSAVAVAAIGYAGYKAYQYFSNKITPLDKLRLAQYGFKCDDQESFDKIRKLEKYLLDFTTIKNGEISLDNEKLVLSKLLDPFGIDMNNRKQMDRFLNWFQYRFKPVYFTHSSIVALMTGKPDISQITKFEKEKAATYLDKTKFEDGPWYRGDLPVSVDGQTATDGKYISTVVEIIKKEMKLEGVKPSPITGIKSATGNNGSAMPVAAEKQEADNDINVGESNPNSAITKSVGVASIGTMTVRDATVTEGDGEEDTDIPDPKSSVPRAVSATAVAATAISKDSGKTDSITKKVLTEQEQLKVKALNREADFYTGSVIELSKIKVFGKLNALDAVRMRLYGMVSLERNKIEAILKLESKAAKNFSTYYQEAPSKFQWQGNANALLDEIRGDFGVTSSNGKDADNMRLWLLKRFLPIFTSYALMYIAFTKKKSYSADDALIKPNDMYKMATVLAGSYTGIWKLIESPWPGYVLNTDPTSIEENIQFLKDQMEKQKVLEDKASKAQSDANAISGIKPKTEAPVPTANAPKLPEQGMLGKPTRPGARDFSIAFGSAGEEAVTPTATATDTPGSSPDPSGLKLASGPMLDGRNGYNLISQGTGVRLDGINPQMLTQFFGMAEEFYQLTGKKFQINSGFRSRAQQAAEYAAHPDKAAKPGTSMHEYGLAMDVQSNQLDQADKLGLMRKYGFTRPVGGEPWHMEPMGVQFNVQGYKQNSALAADAIKRYAGLGGGGLGSYGKDKPHLRSTELSKKIATATISPNVTTSGVKTDLPQLPATANSSLLGKNVDADTQAKKINNALGQASGNNPAAQKGGKNAIPSTPGAEPSSPTGSSAGAIPVPGLNTDFKRKQQDSGSLGKSTLDGPANPQIKLPQYDGTISSARQITRGAATIVGIDPNLVEKVVAVESGFDPKAKGSGSARGLGQIVGDTWNMLVGKHGPNYGITPRSSDPLDIQQNALMTSHYLKDNAKAIGQVKSDVNETDLYSTYFMGPSAGKRFLKTLGTEPETPVSSVVSSDSLKNNSSIFFDKGGRVRSVKEVYAVLENKVKEKIKQFGITSTASSLVSAKSKVPSTGTGVASSGADSQASYKKPEQKATATSTQNGIATASISGGKDAGFGYGNYTTTSLAAATSPTGSMKTFDDQMQEVAQTSPKFGDIPNSIRKPAGRNIDRSIEKTSVDPVKITRQTDPTSAAFGYSPELIAQSRQVAAAVSPMKTTEDILKQSLGHHADTVQTLKEIKQILLERTISSSVNSKENNRSKASKTADSGISENASSVADTSSRNRPSTISMPTLPIGMQRALT